MQATTDWYDFTAPDGSFRISFPQGSPVSRQVTVVNVPRTDYIHYEDGNTFTVEVFESTQYSIDRAEKIFRDYPNPEASGVAGRVVKSSSLRLGQYPGRAVRIEGTTSTGPGVVVIVQHAYLTDGRLYLVTVATGPACELSSKADHFLDSFVILK